MYIYIYIYIYIYMHNIQVTIIVITSPHMQRYHHRHHRRHHNCHQNCHHHHQHHPTNTLYTVTASLACCNRTSEAASAAPWIRSGSTRSRARRSAPGRHRVAGPRSRQTRPGPTRLCRSQRAPDGKRTRRRRRRSKKVSKTKVAEKG
jgi:hypothetical protein